MRGITNAVVYSGGGGSSLIYALNGGQESFAKGEKGFIKNQFNQQEYSARLSTRVDIGYMYGNYLINYSSYGNNYKSIYNGTSFVSASLPVKNVGNRVMFYVGKDVHSGSQCNSTLLNEAPVGFYYSNENRGCICTFYVGDGLALHRPTVNGAFALVKCNEAQMEIGETYYTFTDLPTDVRGYWAFKSGNRLLIVEAGQDAPRGTYLYDISELSVPVLLWSGELTSIIFNITGLNPGDVLFASNDEEVIRRSGRTITLYTIDDDNHIVSKDMPDILTPYMSNCQCLYNPNNNVLSVGNYTDIAFFKYDANSKGFTKLDITIDSLPDNGDRAYFPIISDDLTKLVVIYGLYSGTTNTGAAQGYIIAGGNGRLYAYKTPAGFGEDYVTGFATGNIVDGKVEFECVLPELSLTVNVTPDPDTFEFTGAAE